MLILKPTAGAALFLASLIMIDRARAVPSRAPLPPPRPVELRPSMIELPAAAPLPPPDPRRAGRIADTPRPNEKETKTAWLPRMALQPWPPIEPQTPEPEPADEICLRLLADARVIVKRVARIEGQAGCEVAEPVRLEAVVLDDGARVALEPAPIMACRMAEAAVGHVRDDLAAAALKAGSPLARVLTAAAYECRGRNRVAGAKLSEHATGNALDIRGIVLADKRIVAVAATGMPKPLIEAWSAAACARFTTVLGPGSDGYHEDHIHVDLAFRRSGYRICQWTLEPPDEAPVPSTASAPSR